MKTNVFSLIYDGIVRSFVADSDVYEDVHFIEKFLPVMIDNDKKGLIDFLSAIDSGVKDIYYKKKDQEVEITTIHSDSLGNQYSTDFYNESRGTIKSISIYIVATIAIMAHSFMVIDELNAKLHPLLLKFIIDLFYEENSCAQLIYATHDATLMDKKIFRRDQIWFVQKDDTGHSELIALSDFKVRSDASFEKDYLAGVYGGIPLLKEFTVKVKE